MKNNVYTPVNPSFTFYLKFFIFGGKVFSIIEYACFRNEEFKAHQ